MIKLFSKYTFAGAAGTLIHYFLLILMVEILHTHATIAAFSGATLGALINYLINYYLVFRSQKSHRTAITRFFIIATLGVLLSTSLVHYITGYEPNWYLGGQIAATLLYLLLGFWINKRYTF